ncbi:MAG: hypothetical protein AB7U79_02235 [Candidatus Izemoplasmatales bacterium]
MTNYSIIKREEYINLVFPVYYQNYMKARKLSFFLLLFLAFLYLVLRLFDVNLFERVDLYWYPLVLLIYSIPMPKKILYNRLLSSIIGTTLVHNLIELNESSFEIEADSPHLFVKEKMKYKKIRACCYNHTHFYLYIAWANYPLVFLNSELKNGSTLELIDLLRTKKVKIIKL